MAKQQIKQDFNLNIGELTGQVMSKSVSLQRDLADLTPRGITQARLDAFDALLSALMDVPDDVEALAEVSIAVEEKDKKREDITKAIQDIAGIASSNFGANSAKYRSFGLGKLGDVQDAALYFLALHVVAKATIYLPELSAKGLTQAMIDDLEAMAGDYASLMLAVAMANGNRDLATENRITTANALYAELRDMCGIAQVYYQNRDAARYKHYIIYNEAGNMQRRNGDLLPKETKFRTLVGLTEKSVAHFKNTDAVPYEAWFSAAENGPEGVKKVIILPKTDVKYPIAELGFNRRKKITKFHVHNPNEGAAVGYKVVVK